jgi:hypothetical protein
MPIRIVEVILHILDSRPGGRGLVLSERSLPQQTDPRIFEYFRLHVEHSLGDPQIQVGRFRNPSSQVASSCQDLFAGKTDLVKFSQGLAQRLSAIVGANRSISRGDLAVCLYEVEPGGGQQVALLKIDPVEAFRHTTLQDSKGRYYVSLELETELMPTTSVELQKCAFIPPPALRPAGSDLLLLDHQRTAERDVAAFWIGDFLDADLVTDARRSTLELAKALVAIENILRPQELWPRAEAAIAAVLTGDRVQLNPQWIAGLSLPAEAAAQVTKELEDRQMLDRAFAIDRDALKGATQKLRFQGDFGLKVEVQAAHQEQVIRQVKRVTPKGGPPYYEIVIRSSKWERVS